MVFLGYFGYQMVANIHIPDEVYLRNDGSAISGNKDVGHNHPKKTSPDFSVWLAVLNRF